MMQSLKMLKKYVKENAKYLIGRKKDAKFYH